MKNRKLRTVLALALVSGLLSAAPVSAAPPSSVVSSNGGTAVLLAETGHYYQYVSGPVDFATAKAAAEAARANGWAGYLATFTSSQEYAAVRALFKDSFWIGASDATSEGCWRWVNGTTSDSSTAFFAQPNVTNCSVPGGAYSVWAAGEPNDSNGNQDNAISGSAGVWSDINASVSDATRPNGYLIEYGDRFDFPNPPEVVTLINQSAFSINAISPFNVGSTAPLATTGGSGTGSVSFTSTTTSICTVSGTTLSAVSAGSCAITAIKAADSTYNAATASTSVQISAVVVDTSPPAVNSLSITVTPAAVYENGTFTVSVPVTDVTGVASVSVTVSRNASATNYSVGDQGFSSGTFNLTRTTGTALDGTWSGSSGVNFGGGASNGFLVSGLYDVSVTATDTKGQSGTTLKSSSLTVGRQAAGPTLINSAMSTTSLMRGNSFNVTSRAVAYINTVTEVRVLIAALGISVSIPRVELASYYGDYSGAITIPANTTPGSYAVTISSSTSNGRTTGAQALGTIQVTAQPPTATITLPTSGATVSGTVSITAQASVASGTTGRIAFVCPTINGVKVSSGLTATGGVTWWADLRSSFGPGNSCFLTSSAIGAAGEFSWTIDMSTQEDGPKLFEFYVVDSTGAQGSKVSRTFNVAKSAPTVSFTTPTSGQVLSGPFNLIASGAVATGSTAVIRDVCLTLDGAPVSSGASNSISGVSSGWMSGYYYGRNAPGCWATYNQYGSMVFGWSLDATSWTNGTHTFTIKVIDSTGKESIVASRSVTVNIAAPTVSFTTPTSGQVLSGPFNLIASGAVASGSTAVIRDVCLTLDGAPVSSGASNSISGVSSGWMSGYYYGRNAPGCWATYNQYGSMVFGWSLDATSWTNGTHTFTIKVIDSTGKESIVASRSVTVNIAAPTVSFTTPTSGQVLSGPFNLIASGAVATGSTAVIRDVCLTLDGAPVSSGASNSISGVSSGWMSGYYYGRNAPGCWATYNQYGSMVFGWSLDATSWTNGTHTFTIKVIDSTGKESIVASRSVTVNIAAPTVSFTTPTSGQVLSGPFNLIASGAVASGSTAVIRDVCLTLDGAPVSSGASNSISGVSSGWMSGYYYGRNAPGCWATYNQYGSMVFGWSLDAGSLSNGSHTFTIKVIDSTGKESIVASRSISVNNPPPTLTIVTPSSGTKIAGKVTVEINMASLIGEVVVGITGGVASLVTNSYISTTTSSAAGVPMGSQLWSAGTATSLKWSLDTTKLTPGLTSFTVTAIDRANQVVTKSFALDIQSSKPNVSILSPTLNQVLKGKVTFKAFFGSSVLAQRTIKNIGISESSAKNLFNGSGSYSRLPNKYQSFSVPGSVSLFEGSWTIEYSSSSIGPKEVWFAVEDSEGDITETKVTFTVAKAEPVVQVLTPSQGQVINGLISLKVNATGDPATSGKITKIAISNQKFTPQFAAAITSCNVDSTYKCWSVQDNKSFEWTSEPGAFKDGPLTLTIIAFDDSGNQGLANTSVTISAIAPTVSITSPTKTIVSKEQFTLSASAIPNVGSGAEIIGVAISDRRAVAQFPGTVTNSGNIEIPSTAAIWKVSNIKELSWRIDPSSMVEGDNIINVFAYDSNGKLGQTSIVIHVAPEAKWELTAQGAAVLGKSVSIIVSMTTKTPFKLDPPIVATLQTAPTSGGPWTDTGNLTFDASGKATGRILVTEKLYVRVNHPLLDAIQAGVSEPLRIVNVPDPIREGAKSGTGAKNPDQSIPNVVCTASTTAKVKQKVSIVCSAQDVQDVSQPVQIKAQTSSTSLKKVGTARISGAKITGTFTATAKGTYTVFLVGSGSGFVPWTSKPLKIKVS